MRVLWVIEMDYDRNGKWEPTGSVRFSRNGGRKDLAKRKAYNPNNRFRLTKYAPRSKP